MSRIKGLSLIELMIVLAIIGILAAVAVPLFSGATHDVQIGWGGTTETRCQGGFQVVVSGRGYVQQLVDQHGHGIPCK